MTQQTEQRSYKKTLNLPKTGFAMKANLVQNEPASQKRWAKADLYSQVRAAKKGAAKKGSVPFFFHDGPPYANGSIHLGHLLNKVLKDFVVRTRTMMGRDVPYVPGWDCHGLPIEHKVMADLGDKARGMDAIAIRRKCKSSAEKFVKLQSKQMQRLLTLADYDDPYLTMSPVYEASVLEVFADLVAAGVVYRGLKPVHWSIENRTALADAELEYYDREDTSVFVLFEILDSSRLPSSLGVPEGETVHLMIWTTTPWTLPANVAVAVAPEAEYTLSCYDIADNDHPFKYVLVAKNLEERIFSLDVWEDCSPYTVGSTCSGRELAKASLEYQHPFIDRVGKIVAADYVTLEDGTGLVHTAPGHGVEDYQTGLKEGLDIYCPVRDDGAFDDTAPDWLRGRSVWDANELIVRRLRESGHLFHDEKFTHSYPHDWRGKTPVIFRATEQWFVDVDKSFRLDSDPEGLEPKSLRERALREIGFDPHNPLTEEQWKLLEREKEVQDEAYREAMEAEKRGEDPFQHQLTKEQLQKLTEKLGPSAKWSTRPRVRFFPEWGRNRMRGMLESRPDWCLSRQRAWGLPIPAFYLKDGVLPAECEPLLTAASVRAVAEVVREKGSDAWFLAPPEELLKHYDPTTDPDAPKWAKQILKSQASSLKPSHDIFDVWFESGSSWHAVMRKRFGDDAYPTDLYLEGSDQHRGWFQLSLLPALGATGQSPFKSVLTHGFMVDKDGHKMSKSLGNTLEVDELLKNYGADVCRWWVSSLNTDNDIKVDESYFQVAGEEYRKVRNTIRFLLSNLGDFDPRKHAHDFTDADATSIDAWAMHAYVEMARHVQSCYEQYRFREANRLIFNFCNDALSAVYLAAVKDRLYCDAPDSPRRRRTQSAMWRIASGLIRLLASILPHTADEAWRALHPDDENACVHLGAFPSLSGCSQVPCDPRWDTVIAQRNQRWMPGMERQRQEQGIDNPLDLGLEVGGDFEGFDPRDLADLCGVSQFQWQPDEGFRVLDLGRTPRCERSWKRDGTVKQRSDGGWLSDRDAEAMGLI